MADASMVLPVTTARILTRDGRVFAVRHPVPPMTPPNPDEKRDPLIVSVITQWLDPQSGDPEFWIFSKPAPGSEYEQKGISLLTRIPKDQVVREDDLLTTEALEEQLARIAETADRLRAEAEEAEARNLAENPPMADEQESAEHAAENPTTPVEQTMAGQTVGKDG